MRKGDTVAQKCEASVSKPACAQDLARGQLIPPDFVKICDLKTGRERGGGVHSKRGFGVLQTLGAIWLKGGAG